MGEVRRNERGVSWIAVLAGGVSAWVVTAALVAVPTAWGQTGTPQPGVVSAVPAEGTPDISDGAVFALAEVDGTVVVGGTFTSAAPSHALPAVPRAHILAFDAATGLLSAGFAPVLDGEVRALIPGPVPGTVYVGGAFRTVDGAPMRGVALLDVHTGAAVPGFHPATVNGEVFDLHLSGGRLLMGGTFSRVGGRLHSGLAGLDPVTGALDPYIGVQLTGHHNYRGQPGQAKAGVGPRRFAVSPDGSRLVAIGNFTSADGLARDQAAVIDLEPGSAQVDPAWATSAFVPPCVVSGWDTYMRDVAFAPDGSYFVIVTSGGYNLDGSPQMCDSATRWDTSATGADVRPTWLDRSGGDTLESVVLTGTAVYVGGHMRWMNNDTGSYTAMPGAVPRPGLAALDPGTGVPLAWNPGRNPRGVGATALLATPSGLYVGSDTSWIGDHRYRRGRIAFFPAGPGVPPETVVTPSLPVRICTAGAGATPACRLFDGTTFGPSVPLADGSGIAWATTRWAFATGGRVYAVDASGGMLAAPVAGAGLGPALLVDPYDDPVWSGVLTGSLAGQTYRGLRGPLLGVWAGSVTSAFGTDGQVRTTVAGVGWLSSRGFVPDSGILGSTETVVVPSLDMSRVHGAFVAGDTLYFVTALDGVLRAAPFAGGLPLAGTDHAISGPGIDGVDWRSPYLFVLPG